MFRLAHLSDLHATQVRFRLEELPTIAGKRGLGWLSWRLRRRAEYRRELYEALAADVRDQSPDHIAITGDLTHLGLRAEIEEAAALLGALSAPERLSVVPGNHDAYRAPVDLSPWLAFTSGDRERREAVPCWIRGPVALLGLDSARPTPWPLATGWLGEHQLRALATQLEQLGRRGLYRVLLLHHPPDPEAARTRRGLTDAPALAALLEQHGAELILHGHVHRTRVNHLPGPDGPIPCVGVRAAGARGRHPDARAQYHVFEVEGAEPPFRTRLLVRGLHPGEDRVVALAERELAAA